MKTLTPEKSSQLKFKTERLKGFGGSDAGAVENLGYGCSRALQYDKLQIVQDYPKDETAAMRRGKLLEDDCREEYEFKTGRRVIYSPEIIFDQSLNFLFVHVDGIIEAGKEKEGPGVFEAKVLGRQNFLKQKKAGLDNEYILQMQHALMVTEMQWGSYGILSVDPWELIWFDVARNEELIGKYRADAIALWGDIQAKKMRPKLDAKDKRCASCPWRKTCQGQDFTATLPEEDGDKLEMALGLTVYVRNVMELKALAKEAAELEEAAVADLKERLGARQGVLVPGARVYFREHPKEDWERKEITAEYKRNKLFAALMQKYRKKTTERPLRIYPSTD